MHSYMLKPAVCVSVSNAEVPTAPHRCSSLPCMLLYTMLSPTCMSDHLLYILL